MCTWVVGGSWVGQIVLPGPSSSGERQTLLSHTDSEGWGQSSKCVWENLCHNGQGQGGAVSALHSGRDGSPRASEEWSSVRTFVHMVHHMAPTDPCGNTVHGEQHRSLLWLDHGPRHGHQQHQTLFLKYLEMVVMANCEF